MTNTQPREDELMKALEVFQDYTASWGYPMNQEHHIRGIKIAYERIQDLITRGKIEELDNADEKYYKNTDQPWVYYFNDRYVELQNQLNSKEKE